MSRLKLEGADIPLTGIQFSRTARDGSASPEVTRRRRACIGASALLFMERTREYRSSFRNAPAERALFVRTPGDMFIDQINSAAYVTLRTCRTKLHGSSRARMRVRTCVNTVLEVSRGR